MFLLIWHFYKYINNNIAPGVSIPDTNFGLSSGSISYNNIHLYNVCLHTEITYVFQHGNALAIFLLRNEHM